MVNCIKIDCPYHAFRIYPIVIEASTPLNRIFCRRAKEFQYAEAPRGGRGQFVPGPQGLRSLMIEDFDILIARNPLKCTLSRSKGRDRKSFLLASLERGHGSQVCP